MKKAALLGLLVLVLLIGLLAAARRPAAGESLAEVDGVPVTAAEVEKAIGAPLAKLQEQIYNLRRQKLEEIINERLLIKEAKRRRISVPALLDAEVTSKVTLVTEQEVETFYEANKTRFTGDPTAARQQIRTNLQNQKLAAKRQEFLQLLRSRARIAVYLKPPPVYRVEVSTDGSPFKGPLKAPVTIVKFEDFHCPFCKKVQATIAQLLSEYGSKVRLVHRDFPIDSIHPQARRAHEAARCANEQGKFWQYHDELYTNAPKAELQDLISYAKQVGLNAAAFEQCLSSGKYRAVVQKDVEEGNRLGVTGTPAFFINGRLLSGAQPLASFVSIVEDEISRAR
ncbi:MAG TPA: thioredoxin domain-containing protein [Candidatus Acidoferrales bacterium]|nr:thioredoxin domain-containing protein [Candidatus Acidoferrales bacterium]